MAAVIATSVFTGVTFAIKFLYFAVPVFVCSTRCSLEDSDRNLCAHRFTSSPGYPWFSKKRSTTPRGYVWGSVSLIPPTSEPFLVILVTEKTTTTSPSGWRRVSLITRFGIRLSEVSLGVRIPKSMTLQPRFLNKSCQRWSMQQVQRKSRRNSENCTRERM
jgi:hypothetical protein